MGHSSAEMKKGHFSDISDQNYKTNQTKYIDLPLFTLDYPLVQKKIMHSLILTFGIWRIHTSVQQNGSSQAKNGGHIVR